MGSQLEAIPAAGTYKRERTITTRFADAMLERGVYVIGFSYPVVPQGKARIRTQISAAHTQEDLQRAVAACVEVRRDLGIQTQKINPFSGK